MGESTVIGVHVAGGLLRRAELIRRDARVEVTRLETIPLPAPVPGAQDPPRGASMGKAALNGSRLVASVPSTDVMSRCWPLPVMTGGKMKQLVANRLEADLPVPLEQTAWGYRQAPTARAKSQGPTAVVLAQAARDDRVRQCLAGLAAIGLNVHLLTTEAEALIGLRAHGLRPSDGERDVLVLAGENEWLVGLFSEGIALAVRHIRLQPDSMEAACRECRQLIAAHFPPGSLGAIRWCGAPVQAEAAATLQNVCEVPVQTLEVADGLVRSSGEPLDSGVLPEYGPAIGLALAELFERDALIRLAGAGEAEETAVQLPMERILSRPGRCMAAAGAMLLLALAIHLGALAWETARMEAAAGGHTASTTLRQLQPEIIALRRLQMHRINVEDICADLCRSIKDPITLTSIQLSRERRLVIKGTSKDPKAIFTLADDLRKSRRFQSVNPERASPGQGGDFTISMELPEVRKFSVPGLRGAR